MAAGDFGAAIPAMEEQPVDQGQTTATAGEQDDQTG
jgi:hypothetical protein